MVRLILLLKLNNLLQGYSGVRWQVITMLQRLFNAAMLPCIPAQGSVGASGDLAPLAHLSCVLLGEGEVTYQDTIYPAKKALAKLQLAPLTLAAKEGLALLNGTQVSTSITLAALFKLENCFAAAIVAGCLSLIAANGNVDALAEPIHRLRLQQGQQRIAAMMRACFNVKGDLLSHGKPIRVQDPYSLRCQPQVLGACYDQMQFVSCILLREANAITDNPLIFANDKKIISGGNFHAEPVAMAADNLALAIAELGALAERKIALLMDYHFSDLPPFLISASGINSGLMNAHVTAAALASQNKSLAHPASVDSIPTSANQEDHVSMATNAALRLQQMVDNTAYIISIEWLAAAQGISLRKLELNTLPPTLRHCWQFIRSKAAELNTDRYLATDIKALYTTVIEGNYQQWVTINVA